MPTDEAGKADEAFWNEVPEPMRAELKEVAAFMEKSPRNYWRTTASLLMSYLVDMKGHPQMKADLSVRIINILVAHGMLETVEMLGKTLMKDDLAHDAKKAQLVTMMCLVKCIKGAQEAMDKNLREAVNMVELISADNLKESLRVHLKTGR